VVVGVERCNAGVIEDNGPVAILEKRAVEGPRHVGDGFDVDGKAVRICRALIERRRIEGGVIGKRASGGDSHRGVDAAEFECGERGGEVCALRIVCVVESLEGGREGPCCLKDSSGHPLTMPRGWRILGELGVSESARVRNVRDCWGWSSMPSAMPR